MARSRRKRSSQAVPARVFAWLLALAVALLGWSISPSRAALLLQIVAALIFAVGTTWPRLFVYLYQRLRWLAGNTPRRAVP